MTRWAAINFVLRKTNIILSMVEPRKNKDISVMDDDPDQPLTTIADEDIVDKVVQTWEDERRRLTCVTAGRAGMGKSTLVNNLLRLKGEKAAKTERSARSVTKNVYYYEKNIHGINVRIIDTPGFESRDLTIEQEREAFEALSELTKGKPDLLLYCISLVNRYDDKDDHIVEKLTKAFGSEIWDHAVLVLTYGDELKGDKESRKLLKEFAEEFEESLKKAGVSGVPVIFTQDIGLPDQLEAALARPQVVGVPVGRHITTPKGWIFLLWKEVFNRCRMDAIPAMLVLRGIVPELMAKLIRKVENVNKAHSIVCALSFLSKILDDGSTCSRSLEGYGAAVGTAVGGPMGIVVDTAAATFTDSTFKAIQKLNETFELTVLAMIIEARLKVEELRETKTEESQTKKAKVEELQMKETKVEESQTKETKMDESQRKTKVEESKTEGAKVEQSQWKTKVEELEMKKKNVEELKTKLEELQKEIKALEEQ